MRGINGFLSTSQTRNKSGALLLTNFDLTMRRGDEPLTGRRRAKRRPLASPCRRAGGRLLWSRLVLDRLSGNRKEGAQWKPPFQVWRNRKLYPEQEREAKADTLLYHNRRPCHVRENLCLYVSLILTSKMAAPMVPKTRPQAWVETKMGVFRKEAPFAFQINPPLIGID